MPSRRPKHINTPRSERPVATSVAPPAGEPSCDRLHRQPIANPANGMQIARLRRIRLQFLSQILHPRLHQASEIRVKPLVQVFREIAITAHHPVVPGEIRQELSF